MPIRPCLAHCLVHGPRADAIADQEHLRTCLQVRPQQIDLVAVPLDFGDQVAVEAFDLSRVLGQMPPLVVGGGGEAEQVWPAKGAHGRVLIWRGIVAGHKCTIGWGGLPLADGQGDQVIDLDRVHGGRDLLVGEHEHRAAKALGQVKGTEGERIAVGHRGRAEGDDRIAAGCAPADKLYIPLGGRRRPAGGRAQPLHVDDDQRHLAHDGQADVLRVEADARPAGGGKGPPPGHRRADAKAQRGDLVLPLDGHAAHARQVAHHG